MRRFLAVLFLVGLPGGVFAQSTGGGPPDNVRMRLGPLFINPTLALSNAGEDTNVFNDATNPKRDFTMTISPGTDLWLRFGRSWFKTNIREDIVWFQTYASERSANNTYAVEWRVPLNRITFTPTWAYVNTRERPGFEIDARAERTEMTYGGTVEVQALSRLFFGLKASRATTNFDAATEFLGVSLHDELNRTVTIEGATVRDQITPLTSISVDVSRERDRFDFDPLRDSDSRSISASIKFDPAALLKGGATFGFRDFKPASPDLPGYQGSTMTVDTSYVFLGVTKLAVAASRDVQYSYDFNQPYYLQTGGSLSVSQQIFGPFDVQLRGGVQRLDYQDRAGAVVAVANRVDHVQSYGGGIGYHFGNNGRFGFNVDQDNRTSAVELRQFKGLTFGFAVTYGSVSFGS